MEVDPSNVDAEDASATLRYQAKKSEREDVQKRTFTKWINMRLVRAGRGPISDLFEDMKDGMVLMALIEVLTGQNLNPERGKTRLHHLNNVNHSIKFLERQYNIKLVNICSNDVVDGNTKLVLGLIWNLVLHWQMKDVMKVPGGDKPQSNLEKTLLAWCKQCTEGYRKVNITNFTASFRDGLAFNALFHYFRPSGFNFEDLLKKDNLTNLKHAFVFAEKTFNIEQILDPEDVNVDQPDKKSILIYIMCCYQTLNRLSPLNQHSQISADSSSFVVTSPSSPPPFYEHLLPWDVPPPTQDKVESSTALPAVVEEVSSCSDEVEKFQKTLEAALVWLLRAKCGLGEDTEDFDVKIVKKRFQDHEEFMVHLTEKQTEVGELFEWGSEMVRRGGLGELTEKEVEAQMKLLNQQWEELRIEAMGKQTKLQQTLMQLQQRQLDDLARWLERMEKLMENSKATLQNGSLQERIDSHRALQEEVESQQQQVSSLQDMVVVVDDVNSDDAYEALEKQLENLGHRWAVVCKWVEESCGNLKEGITLWGEYERRKEEFSTWLDSCESRLSDSKIRKKAGEETDFKDIVEQVKQLKMLEVEMDKWMTNFDELSNTGTSLEKYISEHEESINKINHGMQELKDRWDTIVKIMETKSKEIEDSGVELKDSGDGMVVASRRKEGWMEIESIDAVTLEQPMWAKRIRLDESLAKEAEGTSGVKAMSPERVMAMTKSALENLDWLKEKVSSIPNDPVKSMGELNRRRDFYKNLVEQLNDRESAVLALEKDLASSMDVVTALDRSPEIKNVEVVNNWKLLRQKVADGAEQLSSAAQVVNQYNALMKEEMRWQEQMSKILGRKPKPSGDAEELAEELDLLENLICSQNPRNTSNLKELCSQLNLSSHHFQASCLLVSPPEQLAEFTARNQALATQAKERMRHLEDGINAAQSRESQIIDMTQWMMEVCATLQHHLDADLLAGDVPDEHNSLVQEFAEHEEFLKTLERDVEIFKKEGKHEAADRLEQQISLLEKQFDEVKLKLLRFQKPPDFDAKMGLVKRVLEEINDSIQLLEIGGNRIEDIQSQLEHYQKFYKKMSELKPDVEYVVRTGRQVVDKKQVEFPNRLNSQIDAIKMQYNKLGSQVTTGKVSLEKCLRLSRKIAKELDNIRSLVARIEEKFASSPVGGDLSGLDEKTEELVSIDSFLAEANNKKGVIPTLKDAVTQLTRISAEGAMKEPSIDVSEVEEKLKSAIEMLYERRYKLSSSRQEGVENSSAINLRSSNNLFVSPSLLTSVDKFLQKITSFDVHDVDGLKKLVREEDSFETEINLELKRLAKVKDDRKSQGDLEVAEQINNAVNNLQSRWTVCKSELKAKLQQQQHLQQFDNSPSSTSGFLESFHSEIEGLESWLEEAETKVGSEGRKVKALDEKQIQVLRDQTKQHKAELEVIVRRVRSSKDPRLATDASPLLMRVNRRLQKLHSYLPPPPPPVPPSNSVDSNDGRRTPTSELRVQTPLERQIFFDLNGKPVSTALNEVRRTTNSGSSSDQRDDVFEVGVEIPPVSGRVVRSSDRKEDASSHEVALLSQKQTMHQHKDWNIAMPDEMVQVAHHHHHQPQQAAHHHHQPQQVDGKLQQHSSSYNQGVAGPKNKEKFITGLNNFMSVIMEKAKSQPVLIGSIDEIDEAVQKEKTKLHELQAMMPSIKTLVNKLELMQQDPEWSQNTKALTKKLCENWDKAMEDIRERQTELTGMREDGIKFAAEVADFDKKLDVMKHNVSNNNNHNNAPSDVDALNDRMDLIGNLCSHLANKYANDDPNKIQLLSSEVMNKWQHLSRSHGMDAEDGMEFRFTSDTKDLQLWLTRVELIVGNLSEKEGKTCGPKERNQLKTTAEDLKQEVVGRKAFIKTLSSTANQLSNETHNFGVSSQIQGQINDANNRWRHVNNDLDDLIKKLSEHQQISKSFEGLPADQTTQKRNFQKLQEQLLATRSIEDALVNQPPIGDELQNVRTQKAAFQSLLDRINEQRPYVLSTLQDKNADDERAVELSRELEKKWIRIQKMSADRAIELDATIEKITILQESLDDLNQHLSLVEAESSSWLSISELIKTGDVQREIAAVQAFQQKIAPIQGEVDQCNDSANQMGDVVLSHRVVAFLEDVTRRWRKLQSITEERLASLQNVSKRHGSFSQHILTASVNYPWERAATSNNVPYYINHSSQSTHWDHPEMTKLIESLSSYDNVRFSAYRTAMKLRHLQKSLHLDCITLDSLATSFASIPTSKYGRCPNPSSSSSPSSPSKHERPDECLSVSKASTNNTNPSGSSFEATPTSSLDRSKSFRRGEHVVGVMEMSTCLRLCFESLHSFCNLPAKDKKDAEKKVGEFRNVLDAFDANVPLAIDLLLNWLLNIYDSSRNGVMRLSSFKTSLVLMCRASLEDKYKYLCKISADDKGLVDRPRLTRLLKDCILVPKQLGEAGAFGGTNMEPSILSCFAKSGDKQTVTERDFLNWMKLEPQSLVWIPVMHRMVSAEEARHHVKCHCCKQLPVRGLRYRCLKCFSYDLCQNCFFAGKTSKNHKLSHPMQEYSSETTSSEDVRDFTKVFKNKFRSKKYFQKHRRLGYLPVKSSSGDEEDDDDDDELSPAMASNDSTLPQRGTNGSSLGRHLDVFSSNSDGFADEHSLIAQYCLSLKGSAADLEPKSPLQILNKLDSERREEVEVMIKELEDENRNLRVEYERLLKVKGHSGRQGNGWSDRNKMYSLGSIDDDARRIKEKLQILDENNQQLHAELLQLQRKDEGDKGMEFFSHPKSRTFASPPPPPASLKQSSSSSSRFGTTSDGDRELELDRMLQKLQTDDLPVNPGEANVSSLFREVEQINRAVETLVDLMTEDDDRNVNRSDQTKSSAPQGP